MYAMPGNLLSSPVTHTGMPGLICPATVARFTDKPFTPISLDVMPPFATIKFGRTFKRRTMLVTASEIFTDNLSSSSFYLHQDLSARVLYTQLPFDLWK